MASTMIEGLKSNLGGRATRPRGLDAPDAQRSRTRWARLVAGTVVMLASMGGVWLLVQSQSSSVEVWMTRDRLEAGQVLTDGDVIIRSVESDSQLGAVGTDVAITGRTLRMAVPAGSTLVEGHFFSGGDDIGIAQGQLAQVPIVFEEGRVPSVVKVNDLLHLRVISREGAASELFEQVPVRLVDRDERGGVFVTVEVGLDEADRLLTALSQGEAWAAIVGRR